jgi:hypothetical protein
VTLTSSLPRERQGKISCNLRATGGSGQGTACYYCVAKDRSDRDGASWLESTRCGQTKAKPAKDEGASCLHMAAACRVMTKEPRGRVQESGAVAASQARERRRKKQHRGFFFLLFYSGIRSATYGERGGWLGHAADASQHQRRTHTHTRCLIPAF